MYLDMEVLRGQVHGTAEQGLKGAKRVNGLSEDELFVVFNCQAGSEMSPTPMVNLSLAFSSFLNQMDLRISGAHMS